MESQLIRAGTLVAGRYRVIQSLARGGMGEVVHCIDTSRGGDVALKQVYASADGEIDQLFIREATILASLDHPHLARALDFGFLKEGGRYLVMDFVEGFSLATIAQRRAVLAWDLLAAITDQLLAGLAYLHARGIVHRDIKPANLMLSDSDEALRLTIVDLGLAAFRDHALIDLGGQEPDLLAEVGRYATPPYCAPEQLLRHPMFQGPTTDLHAVGIILHLLCSGELPYAGVDEAGLVASLLRKAPAPFVPANAAPPEVGAIVRRLVAKRPWERYDFAVTVRQELAPLWSYDAALEAWRRLRAEIGAEPGVTAGERSENVEGTARRSSLPASELLTLRVARLYGRDREQRRLWEAAMAVSTGGARVVALEGEAGVGKSRLAQWLAEQVHERGLMRTLHASCGRGGGALQGVVGAIEGHFGLGDVPRALVERALVGRWGRDGEASRLARALAAILRPDEGEEEQPALAEPGRDEARARTLLDVVRRIARDRPLLLWVDDLPRADDDTLAMLELLVQQQHSALVLLTGRAEQLAADAEAKSTTFLQRYCDEHSAELIALQPLGRPEVRELLRAVLKSGDDAEGRGVEEVLYRASAGNPLFVLQQLLDWSKRGRIWWRGDLKRYQVEPQALREVARNRESLWRRHTIDLDASATLGAKIATTLGSAFQRDLLERVLALFEVESEAAISALVRERVLVAERDHLFWYHDTLQEYLAAELERDDGAREVHLRVAEAMATMPRASSRERTLLIVRNLLAANEEERGCGILLDLVERQWAQHQVALHADSDLDQIEEHMVPSQAPRYWRMRARAAWARGDFDAADEASKRALALAEAEKLPGEVAGAQSMLGEAHKARGRYDEAAEHFLLAIETYRAEGNGAGEAQACLLLAEGALYMSRHDEAERWMRATLAAAGSNQLLQGVVAEAGWLLASMLQEQGRYGEAEGHAERALALFTQHDHRLGVAKAHWLLATILGQRGALQTCLEHHALAEALFKETGEQWWLFATAVQGSWIAIVCGDWQRALGVAEFLRGELPPSGADTERAHTFLISAAAVLSKGELTQAKEALARVDAIAPREPSLLQTRALLHAWCAQQRGADAEASAHLSEALAIFGEAGITSWGVPWLLLQLRAFSWNAPALGEGLEGWLAALELDEAGSAS